MKILTNKKVDELLDIISFCQITAVDSIPDIDARDDMMEYLNNAAIMIGGMEGANKVLRATRNYIRYAGDGK